MSTILCYCLHVKKTHRRSWRFLRANLYIFMSVSVGFALHSGKLFFRKKFPFQSEYSRNYIHAMLTNIKIKWAAAPCASDVIRARCAHRSMRLWAWLLVMKDSFFMLSPILLRVSFVRSCSCLHLRFRLCCFIGFSDLRFSHGDLFFSVFFFYSFTFFFFGLHLLGMVTRPITPARRWWRAHSSDDRVHIHRLCVHEELRKLRGKRMRKPYKKRIV